MQDNIRAALAVVCEIIRRERRKRDLMHTEVELQRIRVRQRHDPRTNGSLEEAAAFGMAQLKTRNSKNRELDVLCALRARACRRCRCRRLHARMPRRACSARGPPGPRP